MTRPAVILREVRTYVFLRFTFFHQILFGRCTQIFSRSFATLVVPCSFVGGSWRWGLVCGGSSWRWGKGRGGAERPRRRRRSRSFLCCPKGPNASWCIERPTFVGAFATRSRPLFGLRPEGKNAKRLSFSNNYDNFAHFFFQNPNFLNQQKYSCDLECKRVCQESGGRAFSEI